MNWIEVISETKTEETCDECTVELYRCAICGNLKETFQKAFECHGFEGWCEVVTTPRPIIEQKFSDGSVWRICPSSTDHYKEVVRGEIDEFDDPRVP